MVSEQLTLFRKDMRELSTTIPQMNNGYLEARIMPEKGSIVEVRFYKNAAVYCPDPPYCGFFVKGSDIATQQLKIPVVAGDSVEAVIRSSQSTGFSQLVNVVLSVQYEEHKPVDDTSSSAAAVE
ncbi:hypothetical protein NWT39_04035 [Nitrososphaera viennensis]|uniref:Uncharacterized protein n=1 Tax=Nitrososphaera viennensis TaxID=1034015 RepID=A0A977IFQ5_9ARCH|nr:hypothetical protein [Nitrososphaera viennensis]UVS69960.1 hypothetical protein NWT39_04035 [Nitrososphaera viennensis]